MNHYIKDHVRLQQVQIKKWLRLASIITFPILFILFFVIAPGWWGHQRYPISLGLESSISMGLGGVVALSGFGLYIWTIVLFGKAHGTQVPLVPTQKLVTSGPYSVSRNPMVTGSMIMVTGIGIGLDSASFILAGYLIPGFYLVYVKLIEEKELEARFGQVFQDYKKKTPFILPKLFKRK